jgi:Ca2+-binding EF-hand superfamily protein
MKVTAIILLVGTAGVGCQGVSDSKPPGEDEATKAASAKVEATATAENRRTLVANSPEGTADHKSADTVSASLAVDNLGRVQAAPELQQAVSWAMAVADSNGDGKITRDELNGALNFVIGGFFFRADANADGRITPKERAEARADFAKDHPEVGHLLTPFSTSAAVKTLMASLDINFEQTIELKQTRSTIREAVDGIFDSVDKNSDDTISASEANQSFHEAAAALGRAAFARADTNSDGSMTLDEFHVSLNAPLKRAFESADANDDGKLTDAEAASMMWWFGERIDAASGYGYEALSNVTTVSLAKK